MAQEAAGWLHTEEEEKRKAAQEAAEKAEEAAKKEEEEKKRKLDEELQKQEAERLKLTQTEQSASEIATGQTQDVENPEVRTHKCLLPAHPWSPH